MVLTSTGAARETRPDEVIQSVTVPYLLIPWSRVLLEKLTGSQLVKKFPAFYGTRRFITAFTYARKCPYPKPARSSPYPTSYFLKINLNIILPPKPGSPKCSFSFRFPHQNPVYNSPLLSSIRATSRAHIILVFITRTISGEQYRSLSSSLCSFLHSHVTSSLLRPNIHLNTLFSKHPQP